MEITINNIKITSSVILKSKLISNAVGDTTHYSKETYNIHLEWVTQDEVKTFNSIAGCLEREMFENTSTYKYIVFCDYFIISYHLCFLYMIATCADKFRIHTHIGLADKPHCFLEAEETIMLRNEGYNWIDILSYAKPNALIPIDMDIKKFRNEMMNITPAFNIIEYVKDCFIAGGSVVLSLLNIEKNTSEYPPDMDVDIYCSTDEAALNLIHELKKHFDTSMFEYNSIILVFIKGERHCLQIIRCGLGISSTLVEFDLDCCMVGYNGSIQATPAFHKCMLNNWTFELLKPVKAYRLIKYKERGINIININGCELLENHADFIEANRNKYLKYVDESPTRLLYLVRALFGLKYSHLTLPLKPIANKVWIDFYNDSGETYDATLGRIWSNGSRLPCYIWDLMHQGYIIHVYKHDHKYYVDISEGKGIESYVKQVRDIITDNIISKELRSIHLSDFDIIHCSLIQIVGKCYLGTRKMPIDQFGDIAIEYKMNCNTIIEPYFTLVGKTIYKGIACTRISTDF